MTLSQVLLGASVLAVLSNVGTLIAVMSALDRRGQKTNMLSARLRPFKYVKAYKEATEKETGKPGPLYRLWIVTINLALVFAVAWLLVSRPWLGH